MKKIIYLLVVVAMAVVSACGGSGHTSKHHNTFQIKENGVR